MDPARSARSFQIPWPSATGHKLIAEEHEVNIDPLAHVRLEEAGVLADGIGQQKYCHPAAARERLRQMLAGPAFLKVERWHRRPRRRQSNRIQRLDPENLAAYSEAIWS
jgi:hypothetical protein